MNNKGGQEDAAPDVVTADERYAVNATIKGLDKLEAAFLKHPKLKAACRAARACFVKALAEAEPKRGGM